MITLAEYVSNFNYWYMLSLMMAFVIADFFFFGTTVLLAISIALVIPLIANFLSLHPVIQLWSYPVSFLGAYFLQPKLFIAITSKSHPYELEKQFFGAKGVIIISPQKNEAENYFYRYKKTIKVETENISDQEMDIMKVRLETGEIFLVENSSDNFVEAQRVRVKGFLGNAALVEPIKM